MTVLDLLQIALLKPLLLVLLGWLQLRSYARLSAACRQLSLLILLAGLPLLVLVCSLAPPFSLALPVLRGPLWLEHPVGVVWSSVPLVRALLLAVIGVALLLVLQLVLGLAILGWRQRRLVEAVGLQAHCDQLCQLAGLRRRIQVRAGEAVGEPYTWGYWRPQLVVPATLCKLPAAAQQLVLLHEIGHVARRDWPVSILVRVVVAVFWFVPGLRRVYRHFAGLTEQACDDWVLAQGAARPQYAQMLTVMAASLRQRQALPALFVAGAGSAHYCRVMALLDGSADHGAQVRDDRSWLLLAGLLTLLPLMAVQATVQSPQLEPFAGRPLTVMMAPAPQQAMAVDPTFLRPVLMPQPASRPDLPRRAAPPAPPAPLWSSSVLAPDKPVSLLAQVQPQVLVQGYLPLRTVLPEYPGRALRRGVEGRVIVQFAIDTRGRVVAPEVIHASPAGYFEAAVLAALRDFTFAPQRINGEAVITAAVTEEFLFSLGSDAPVPRRQSVPATGQTAIALKY